MRKRKNWIQDSDCTGCSQRSSKFRRTWMWQPSRPHSLARASPARTPLPCGGHSHNTVNSYDLVSIYYDPCIDLSVQHLWTHFIFSITRCDRHQNLTLHVRRLRSSPQGGSGCGCARSEDSVREPAPSSSSVFHIGIPSFRESQLCPSNLRKRCTLILPACITYPLVLVRVPERKNQ